MRLSGVELTLALAQHFAMPSGQFDFIRALGEIGPDDFHHLQFFRHGHFIERQGEWQRGRRHGTNIAPALGRGYGNVGAALRTQKTLPGEALSRLAANRIDSAASAFAPRLSCICGSTPFDSTVMMALDPTCEQFTGKILFAATVYGWGWGKRTEANAPNFSHLSDTPKSFHFRVKHFHRHLGFLRGMVGQVEESGHDFDGFWLACDTRTDEDFWNLTTLPTHYNIHLGRNEPTPGKPSPKYPPNHADAWPIWELTGNPAFAGYCQIAETRTHLEEASRLQKTFWDVMTEEEKRQTPEIVFERMQQALLSKPTE